MLRRLILEEEMADFNIYASDAQRIVDALAEQQNPLNDTLMEIFGEIAREAEHGRDIIVAVGKDR